MEQMKPGWKFHEQSVIDCETLDPKWETVTLVRRRRPLTSNLDAVLSRTGKLPKAVEKRQGSSAAGQGMLRSGSLSSEERHLKLSGSKSLQPDGGG